MFQHLFRRWVVPGCLGLLILLVAGCGNGATQVTNVTGTLRYQGKPVPQMLVFFVPAEGRRSYGLTNEQGKFSLSFDRKTPGAAVGRNQVYLEYRQPSPTAPAHAAPEYLPLLEKYGRLDTTPLRFDVNKDGQDFDLDLD